MFERVELSSRWKVDFGGAEILDETLAEEFAARLATGALMHQLNIAAS